MNLSRIAVRLTFVVLSTAGWGPAHAVSTSTCPYGPAQCLPGYVWREAYAGDVTCVTPDVRAQAAADNAAAASRKVPNGAYGPDTCVMGYVWREAIPTDHVCVTGVVRTQTAADNAAAASRVDPACTAGVKQPPTANVAPAITNKPLNPNGAPPLPTWPQNFTIDSLSPTIFGFPVLTQGPISVKVQAQGGPLIVSLLAPGGRVVAERQGAGAIAFDYAATAADVAAGVSWSVGIRSAVPGKPPIQVVATGSITVAYPPVDPVALQAALQAQSSKAQAQLAQIAAVRSAAPVVTVPMLSANAQAKAAQQLVKLQQSQLAALRGTNQIRGSVGGLVPKPAPVAGGSVGTPSFTLSTAQGTPGTPVDISGANLGATPGEVHVLIANGQDRIASIDLWTVTQIRFVVPDATGLPVYDGMMRVVRADGAASTYVPFRFLPRPKTVVLGILKDGMGNIQDSHWTSHCPATGTFAPNRAEACDFENSNPFAGFKGDDEFYLRAAMINGWVVQDVGLLDTFGTNPPYTSNGGVYLADSRIGSNSPYVKVHWWVGVLGDIAYRPIVTIVGPQGLPCGITLPNGSDACMQP